MLTQRGGRDIIAAMQVVDITMWVGALSLDLEAKSGKDRLDLVEEEGVGILLRSLDRAEGPGKSPHQRPTCVHVSGPVLQRL